MRNLLRIIAQTTIFWEHHRALYYGLALLGGSLIALGNFWVLFALSLLLASKKPLLFLIPLLFALIFVKFYYHFPAGPTTGTAHFSIHSITQAPRGCYLYRGTVKKFSTDEKATARHLPCQIYAKTHSPANTDYLIHGTLKKGRGVYYTLKTKDSWSPIKNSFSSAQWRFGLKQKVQRYIRKHISHRSSALFLAGLATGEICDRTLWKIFGNLGLSHIMAISGLHFAVLALLCSFLLRLFLPYRASAATLLLLMTGYFLFIGHSPSIELAWIMVLFPLLGILFEARTNSLNNLGLALIFSLLINPLAPLHLGFQLSFLATAALLILYQPVDSLLKLLIPKRTLSHIIEKSLLSQHLYVAGSLLRKACALTLAVHLALIPLLLQTFHSFGWHSLIYNLFFPFLASLSLLLLLIGSLVHLILPPLGQQLHSLNSHYTHLLLTLTDNSFIPQRTLYVETIPPLFTAIYLPLLFLSALMCTHYIKQKREGLLELKLSI